MTPIEKADELLIGAIDMHAHGYPQFTINMPPRVDNLEWALAAQEAGMAGIVIKSHMWPTASEAFLLNKMADGIKVFGSITLNYVVGGLDPFAVQVAAELGAKVVFMPTWSSKNDMDKGTHYFDRMRPYIPNVNEMMKDRTGIRITDDSGALLPEACEIISLCKQYGLVLATGHISIEESLALCKAATGQGVKFVLTHPLNTPLIGATLEQQRAVAGMGGYVEHVFIGCMPMHQRMHPKLIAEAIDYIGYEHCIMSSDSIEAWNPKPPEVLRMYIATMLALGIPAKAVYRMTHTNPGYMLGIE